MLAEIYSIMRRFIRNRLLQTPSIVILDPCRSVCYVYCLALGSVNRPFHSFLNTLNRYYCAFFFIIFIFLHLTYFFFLSKINIYQSLSDLNWMFTRSIWFWHPSYTPPTPPNTLAYGPEQLHIFARWQQERHQKYGPQLLYFVILLSFF